MPELKLKLNEDGSHYLKFTFLNQVWLRYNQSNPGTLVMDEEANETFDIGLRRTRVQFFGQISDRVFFYTQFGMNNFNFLSQNAGNRKLQAFFHDAIGEYILIKGNNPLKFGAGLTITTGLSRFSQPSVGSIMTMDVPVFAQVTVDQIDEFARNLSFYFRGQLGKLDYRLIMSDPFPVSTNGTTTPAPGNSATFASRGHHYQYKGFLIWNFFEREPHTTPYMTGTYLGKKRIFNLETGLIHQKNATWTSNGTDTSYHNMLHWSIAAFLDIPVNGDLGTSLSVYAGYFFLDYGPDYIRNNGVMNPANGLNNNASFNGTGNAFPMFGTGSMLYAQAGYKFKNGLLGDHGTIMPFTSLQYAHFNKLDDPMIVIDAGVNWLMTGHSSKLSIGLQNRPVFDYDSGNNLVESERKKHGRASVSSELITVFNNESAFALK